MNSKASSPCPIPWRRVGWNAAALLLACSAIGATATPEPGDSPVGQTTGTPVMVTRASRACLSSSVHASGYLVPRAEAIADLPLDGYEVTEVFAREGENVVERQPLARLGRIGKDPTQGSGNSSSATAAVPASIVLKASVPGRIVASTALIGATAVPRVAPLFRIAIDGLIEADVEVSSIYLDKIAIDQPVRIASEHSREIGGRVRAIASEVSPVTQMGHVRIALDGDADIRVGRFVRATIDVGESCGIAVPLAAVRHATDGASVQVVRGNLVETIRVKTGVASNNRVEVLAGLREGDVVVAHAGTSLRDGDRVAPDFLEASARPTGRR